MQHTKQIETLLTPLINRIKSKGSLGLVTVLSCVCMNVILPDQYLGISLPGQMYEKTYADRNIDRSDLAVTLLGGGAVTSPLIPWNTCGIYVMTILSVPAVSYGPFAFYSIILPLTVVLFRIHQKRGADISEFYGNKSTVRQFAAPCLSFLMSSLFFFIGE